MSEKKSLSDTIIEMGDEFAIDAMEDYDDRIKSGEFENLTYDEIRQVYLDEAIDAEQDEDQRRGIQATIDREEAEENDQ